MNADSKPELTSDPTTPEKAPATRVVLVDHVLEILNEIAAELSKAMAELGPQRCFFFKVDGAIRRHQLELREFENEEIQNEN